MKHILFLLTLLLTQSQIRAQNVSINTSGDPAHPSAMLDISSNSKGVLIPRMTETERLNIQNPAQGLLVYDMTSRSFWFNDGGWTELGGTATPTGPAGGDLSGDYPTPNVVKIQNLDVASGVPFDKQVLKWDALSNNWKGRNDSLFLPYTVSFGSPTKLFGITNNNTTAGSSAVFGRSSAPGSGINPGFTMGVWGDNSTGQGVAGTSNTGNGVFGSSIANHGITGYTGSQGYAGVYGSSVEFDGYGVMGEIEQAGIAVFGQSTGNAGIAGAFQTTSSSHTDTTFIATTQGLGELSLFNVSNETNSKPAIDIEHAGNGMGLKVRMNKASGAGNGIDVLSQGSGIGVYSKSQNGIAGKFENSNASNSNPVLFAGNQGFGTTLFVSSLHTGTTGPAVDVFSMGIGGGVNVSSARGKAGVFSTIEASAIQENINATTIGDAVNAIFNSNHTTSLESAIEINQLGRGKGIDINLSNEANTKAGLYVNTAGNKGAEVISAGVFGVTATATGNGAIAINGNTGQTANNAIGVKGTTGGSVTNGIGVLGQAGSDDPNGIGVKGIAGGGIAGGIGVYGVGNESNPQAIGVKGVAYTHNEDVGAVTGINMTDGVGVYGESVGFDGIGVVGVVGNTDNHSVAAMFKNNYDLNNRAVVEVISNGKGNGLLLDHSNLTSTAPLLRMKNSGTGQFLRLEDGLGDIKTTLEKDGDLTTDGTVTVKGNKGIIRNSGSSQMRVEVVMAVWDPPAPFAIPPGTGGVMTDITFATPFSSPPVVYVANAEANGWTASKFNAQVYDVTTTGCSMIIYNVSGANITLEYTEWKLVAMGAE
jgi:H-type lectin domain